MRAALFRHKQPGDLTLHARGDQDGARLGQRLHPRGNVGDIAINLAARIEDGGAGFKADAGDELRLGRTRILAIEVGQGALDRQRGACRALGIVLVRQRIAEQTHQPVAELLRDVAAHFGDRSGSGVEIGTHEVAPFLGIELRGDRGRAHQIAEHHREIAALTGGFGGWRGRASRCLCGRHGGDGCTCGWYRCWRRRLAARLANCCKYLASMTK